MVYPGAVYAEETALVSMYGTDTEYSALETALDSNDLDTIVALAVVAKARI